MTNEDNKRLRSQPTTLINIFLTIHFVIQSTLIQNSYGNN